MRQTQRWRFQDTDRVIVADRSSRITCDPVKAELPADVGTEGPRVPALLHDEGAEITRVTAEQQFSEQVGTNIQK